ncbi:hypothetical protein N8I77_011411 [Diaporthe amygdali]|uniref:Aldehyde dehydrogenase domain-containing protein n=1 Tax=Phomopsis amygdali TaxID=1214568 RepID=A0AAD9W109_PHOAM|nr:hypothetical protein N8I77_011411 [Diaporthe amygdali]
MSEQFRLRNPALLIGRNYINGEWLVSCSGNKFEIHDPAPGELIGTCPESTVRDVEDAIDAAARAFPLWRNRSGCERVLRRWYDLLMENADDLVTLISWENAWFRVSILKEPVSVCGLIVPTVTRKISPALAAECSVVIKSAGETPFSANAITLLGEQAGVPKGVVNVVCSLQGTPEIGQTMCTSSIVRKISFTGSTRVGRLLMKQSSDTVKKLSLELGVNAPVIVFNDADIDLAVKVRGLLLANSRSEGRPACVPIVSLYRMASIFARRLADVVRTFKIVVPPMGPLIHAAAVEKVFSLVEDAVRKGAKAIVGGTKRQDLGVYYGPSSTMQVKMKPSTDTVGAAFYAPTILTDVRKDMRLFEEEIFGPVAPLFRFVREEEAVNAANDADVGLGSYIYTQDINRAARVTETLHYGMVALNTGVMADASAPFGGIKQSGLGREDSKYGISDYIQLKTVVTGNVIVTHCARIQGQSSGTNYTCRCT